jgi:O-antigen/teichoic acid export membrane protein
MNGNCSPLRRKETAMNQPGIALDSAPGFGERVRSAVIWRWGSQLLAQIITWTTTIMVVRLLAPADYGLFAMTQAVLTALNFLNGYSFASSLIQQKEVDERRIGQVFGLLIIAALVLAGAQLLIAPYAADFYHQPQVADMLRIQALIYLTTPFIALPASLLARGLEFRSQALVNLACAVAGAAAALTLAWMGYGVWALVWAPIVMFSLRALGLTVAAGGTIRPVFDFRGARAVFGFGTALTLCQLFWIVQSQSDIIIAGHYFVPHDLGLYSEALFLVLIFTGRFLPPLNEVTFAAFAELNNTGQPVGPAFVSGVRMIMLIAAPCYVGLSLVAGPLVTTFFGPKWLEMIPIVAGLAIAMPAMALQFVCSPATNAVGRPGVYVITNAFGAVIMPVCFFFGVAWGPHGLMTAWQIAAPLLLLATLAATLPVIRVNPLDLVRALLPAACGCGMMALVVWLLDNRFLHLPAPLQLAALAAAGAAVYAGSLWLGWPDVVRDTWAMLRKPRKAADQQA